MVPIKILKYSSSVDASLLIPKIQMTREEGNAQWTLFTSSNNFYHLF